jgi:putative alpha-1,2-mannosidase
LVDPFVGCAAASLPEPQGLARTWWWPKPQVGNTHPGACYPLGMVSACAYSGGYPSGYGLYAKNTEGVPPQMFDSYEASGFSHFQQSGTGAIRKYYNYFRVTPLAEGLEALGQRWPLEEESAQPGYYRANLGGTGITCELTVGEKAAVHRYTFPAMREARIAVDFSCGGLSLEHGRTLPRRADLELVSPGCAQGTVVLEGVPLSVYIEIDRQDLRQSLWYNKQAVGGGTRLVFDYIRATTLRPFGVEFTGPMQAGEQVEVRIGFSLRGVEQAKSNCERYAQGGFDGVMSRTQSAWNHQLARIRPEGGTEREQQLFYTALYHSLIKPCFARDESPFWPSRGPFVFDICTMWDIYKTQLPLLSIVYPERSVELLNSLVRVAEEEGNFPIGYRMSRGADRFFRQASALAHTALADAHAFKLPGIDWEWALTHMHVDLHRTYGEDFLEQGVVHPLTHTLDLAYGYHCTARVARSIEDHALAEQLEAQAKNWTRAFDAETGLLRDSTYYEGTKHNYSFRLLHDMAARIDLCKTREMSGDEAFVALLDEFFGFGAGAVTQLGEAPSKEEVAAGYALGRFEGLNNEPDMEAPYAYYYAGRPDRTAQVVGDIVKYQYGLGRGGLCGNDDSGAISSWYVWSTIGLFPVAGQAIFLIGVPRFDAVTLRVGDRSLRISRRNMDENPQYVTGVSLNGKRVTRSYLHGTEVLEGGKLVVELSSEPSGWGTVQRPPSVSTDPLWHRR